MAIPDYQSVMRPLLAFLSDGQLHSISDIHDALCKHFELTPDEIKERLTSGNQTIIRNRVGWARTYLSKAGLISVPQRAHAIITERGRQALAECPERIDVRYLKRFEEFRAFHAPKAETSDTQINASAEQDETTPEEQLTISYQAIIQSLADELITTIRTATPTFFEQLVVDLMLAMGYGGSRKEAGRATQPTGDDGIDGIIKEDRLGLDIIYLQAKRWKKDNTVHRPEIDKFIGSLTRHRARKGVFITTSDFSNGAKEAIRNLDMKVVLIDGQQLAELMIEHNLGVTTKDIYAVKQFDSDYFSEDD